jgi:hypothetical protein
MVTTHHSSTLSAYKKSQERTAGSTRYLLSKINHGMNSTLQSLRHALQLKKKLFLPESISLITQSLNPLSKMTSKRKLSHPSRMTSKLRLSHPSRMMSLLTFQQKTLNKKALITFKRSPNYSLTQLRTKKSA